LRSRRRYSAATGTPLSQVFNITQHAGLDEDVYDHRLNTRTVLMNPVVAEGERDGFMTLDGAMRDADALLEEMAKLRT
jgi:hypothetical protein